MKALYQKVGIVGTGAMGRGIAQLAAQAGSHVVLFDAMAQAASNAQQALLDQWVTLSSKGKISPENASLYGQNLSVASDLSDLADCDLIIEAIKEDLNIKQSLFKSLEAIVQPNCVLASNTSSLSITAIAAALERPQQFLGMHFFNPVPLMKVVEIIGGLRTHDSHIETLLQYGKQMGHTAVKASDTPGFIVNHAGRGYNTEALRIISESITDFATVDQILKDQLGFKLGPFELMDLTGLDVSHPVMESIYDQYYQEARYRPSPITAQRLAGGVLGRKTGRGFYNYDEKGQKILPNNGNLASTTAISASDWPSVWVSPKASRRQALLALLKNLGATIETGAMPSPTALIMVAPMGFDVTTLAAVERLDPTRTVGIDMLVDDAISKRRVIASNPATRLDMLQKAQAIFSADAKPVSVIKDSAGFVSQRVVATIVNIGSDICQQSVCSPEDLDKAVQIGLGYPHGPLGFGDYLDPANILEILFNMQTVYGDMRYRPSPWLRRRAALGLSLKQAEQV